MEDGMATENSDWTYMANLTIKKLSHNNVSVRRGFLMPLKLPTGFMWQILMIEKDKLRIPFFLWYSMQYP